MTRSKDNQIGEDNILRNTRKIGHLGAKKMNLDPESYTFWKN